MARALIVGCGCRGRGLAGTLAARGWQVRGTSRRPEGLGAIEEAGIDPARADPDRPGTVLDLCGDVAVVVWLLGSAAGQADAVAAIHGARLRSLLEKLVDSPVRGFAYESVGWAAEDALAEGAGIVQRAGETWRIPVTLLDADPEGPDWTERTADAIAGLVAA